VRPPAPSVSFRSGAAERARTGLEAARTLAHEDPRAASNAGAALLRAFASARFRCELQALTTDEIASRPPGALAPDCIADLVGLLGRYDAERFRKDALAPGGADVRDNLLASIRFIDRWAEGERRR
jgi:hypothetical protein